MATLTDSLNRILTWLNQSAPDTTAGLQPGLSPTQITDLLEGLPFKVSQEVYELYQWRNGDNGCNALFVYHWLLPLEQTIDYSHDMNESFLIEMREEAGAPSHLFPLFDFDGEYFAVPGREQQLAETPVYHIGCDDGAASLAFTSLANMMLAIAECYEAGIYKMSGEGLLEVVDEHQFGEIRQKYNPGTVDALYVEGW